MPSKSNDVMPFTTTDQLMDDWQTFLGNKFTCAAPPRAVYNSDINDNWPDEDIVQWDKFDECVHVLRINRAPCSDLTPIEAYLASPSAKQKLYELVCLTRRKENIPDGLVHALFMLYKKG